MAHVEQLSWAPSLGFELTVRVDSFSLLILTIISGVGTLVLIYSVAYFAVPRPVKTGPEQPASAAESQEQSLEATSALRRKARIGALLVAFAGAMAGVVVCDNVLAIFMFWELTSVISFLLIGTEDHSPSARAAALRVSHDGCGWSRSARGPCNPGQLSWNLVIGGDPGRSPGILHP
ncbi:MAG: hypothetical protein R2735_02075 [Microthrixaceae bacterium]